MNELNEEITLQIHEYTEKINEQVRYHNHYLEIANSIEAGIEKPVYDNQLKNAKESVNKWTNSIKVLKRKRTSLIIQLTEDNLKG